MIITGKRIRKLDRYISGIKPDTPLVVGINLSGIELESLRRTGFTEQLQNGEVVLPDASIGPVSRFNAEGNYTVHKDKPMETAYRMVEWHWEEWHGPYREDQSKIVDVPYQRYPRAFNPPPAFELRIAETTEGERIVIGPTIKYNQPNEAQIVHLINLFLEAYGQCQVYSENLNAIIQGAVKRLNWRILPPGRHPWSQLKREIKPIIDEAPGGKQPIIEYRLETINRYGPDFVAVGHAGFRGYLIFGLTERKLFILESIHVGNATYVFGERWEELSKLTKAEILNQRLQKDRIIHNENWPDRITSLLRPRAA